MFGFSRRKESPRGSLADELAEVERKAAVEQQHIQARLFNQAGDLCAKHDDMGRAKVYYGRSIDAYLDSGYFEAAAALCRKLIRCAPEVIRARATLAVLYLGKKLVESAQYEIDLVEDYIRAARHAGDEQLLVYRLRVMVDATENQELRVLIGQRLLELGDGEWGRKILHGIYREINGLAEPPQLDAGEQWDRLLRAATMTPNDLVNYAPEADVVPDLPRMSGTHS